jgi:hypothetical protein
MRQHVLVKSELLSHEVVCNCLMLMVVSLLSGSDSVHWCFFDMTCQLAMMTHDHVWWGGSLSRRQAK